MKIGFLFVTLLSTSMAVSALAATDAHTGSVLLGGVATPISVTKIDDFDGYSITLGAETGVGTGTPTVPETSSVIIAEGVDGSAGRRTFFTYLKDDEACDPIFDEQLKLLVSDQTLANKAEINCLPESNAIVTVLEDGKAPLANCTILDR